MAEHNDLGKWGEDLAADYLQRKGYMILERDWKAVIVTWILSH